MLIVAIEGGLGNQMFQYAFFLALQNYYKQTEIKIDLGLINPKMHNGYELQRLFHINPSICSKRDTLLYSDYCPHSIKGSGVINFVFGVRRKLLGRKKSFILQRDGTEFLEECFALDLNRNYYFKGCWINTRYFEEIKNKIVNTFVFPPIIDQTNLKWKTMIEGCNSISIHFRGGDYYKEGFSVLSNEYYAKAINYIINKVSNSIFFIFTDDIDNAKQNIPVVECCHYIDNNNGQSSYIDMQLMAMCRHNIIANSTFSFWGAYLNKNSDKIVIAPNVTCGNCSLPYTNKGWILL